MTKIIKKKFFDKIQNLDEYIKYLEALAKETKKNKVAFVSDFHFFGLAERYLQLSIQTIIDLVQMIIIEEKFERPEENQEAISLLFEKKIISKKLASRLDGIVGFRNILVHEYGKIDKEKVYDYLQERIVDLKDFKKEILKLLKK
ncbi:MAG: hypothetical protein UR69_C0003G0090 [Candidatus Moranbacteria bacterium GW2011_GWE2_35_2-]|nr:MAG: hypothetical protein UR69_C0003G0090 [Candidatus Moranbacteria bacterium GW2011_GWE2_35_2-]KKQ22109.1 MAG: hypothetical protein US37_C0004G0068 [Candidatus Moranbacteria bacterium GW2011_GWF2_37_11]KKQ29139.1 MAG: hypothetical protein US44_C0003G0051 [Candidatus Moranbacteria bacterium GW2011_GWD1_37_17]KKQ31124.1 MAG: hypothetical protein US47_C0001G0357 [Candidatus Moranbacteria bacterium GW2011_GWE1_37_24]HBO16478.1 hypothetical protein [Candidatus Moranbacteria bacterium]